MNTNINIKNKKAYFDYSFLDTYIAGIMLTGTEIKSIREGKASLTDTYCIINKNEVILKNSFIAKYENGTYSNHEEKRDRKLLLNKDEIEKIRKQIVIPGYTLIPIRLFINNKGLAKLEISICKGKKEFDKRQSLKEKDDKREIDRILKNYK